jgi:hypothetical protein
MRVEARFQSDAGHSLRFSRRLMRSLIVGVGLLLLAASSASAAPIDPSLGLFSTGSPVDIWRIDWLSSDAQRVPTSPAPSIVLPSALFQQGDAQPLHAAAVEHSDAYEMRKKIHKYASFATLPLFATEFALGQSLYNTPGSGSRRGAHAVVGASIVSLFVVNTVTGAWNMFGEDRKDPKGRMLRLVHGLLMMAADVGFVATAQSGPDSESRRQALTFETSKATHRNIALASISIGTAGYLVMLFGNH